MGIFGGTTQSPASSGSPGLFGTQEDIQRHIALGALPSAKPAAKAKPQPKPKSNTQKALGFLGGVGKDVAQPLFRTGEAVSQGIGNAELKVAGRPTENAKQFSADLPKPVQKFADYKGTKKQIAGDLFQTAGDVIAPSSGSVIKGVASGAALGAGTSAINQGLQTGNIHAKPVLESAGLAAVLGGLGGHLHATAANRTANKVIEAKNAAATAAKTQSDAAAKVAAGGRAIIDSTKPKTTNLLGAGGEYAKKRIAQIDDELAKYTGGVGSKMTTPQKTLDNLGTDSKVAGSRQQLSFERNKVNGKIVTTAKPKPGDTVSAGKFVTNDAGTTAGTVAPETQVGIPNKSAAELRGLMRERQQLQDHLDTVNAPKTAQTAPTSVSEPVTKPTAPTSLSGALADVQKPVVQDAVKLKPGVATLGSKATVLSKLGNAGKQLSASLLNTDKTHLDLRTKYENQIPTVLNLKGASVGNFWDTVEGKSTAVTPEVDKAVQEWKNLSPQVRNDATAAGVKVGNQKNFLPRSYDFAAIQKDPAKYAEVLQNLVETKQAKGLPEAKSLFDSFAHSTGGPNQFGHFENSRKLDVGGYKKDINTIRQYLDQGARRTAEATHLGASNEKATDLINQLHPTNRGIAKEAVRNYLHTPDQSGGVNKVLAGTRALFGTARLGKAALSHAGQTTNVAVSANGRALLRGWMGTLSKADRDFAKSTGTLHPSELHGLVEQATGLSGKLGRATAPGLTHVMEVNRIVASVAGRQYGKSLASKGGTNAISRLKELGVTGDIGNKLTPNQEIQAARGVVKETMFDRSRANTPIKAETSIGKSVGQYRLAYGYKQTGLIYNRVVGEAKKGNLSPLLHYLAISAPVTGGTIALKNKISGSREGAGGVAADTASLGAGIPGETLEQAARYGKKDVLKTAAGTVAPIAGEAVDVGERVQKSVGGDNKPLGRYASGLVPIVGNRVSAKEFPYGSNTAQAVQNQNKDVGNELQKLNYTVTDTNRKSGRAAKLNDAQYKDYTTQSSQLFSQKTQKALKDPEYQKLSPADKKATLQQNLRDSRNTVMTKIAGKYTPSKTKKYKKY